MLRSKGWLLLSILLAAGLVLGLARLLILRFEKGDAYPPYSSFRADPLGAKLFGDSLAELPGLSVRRNTESFVRLKDTLDQTTLFILGIPPREVQREERNTARDISAFLTRGGRLVVTLYPTLTTNAPSWIDIDEEADDPPKTVTLNPTNTPPPPVSPSLPPKKTPRKPLKAGSDKDSEVNLEDRWKFALGYQAFQTGSTNKKDRVFQGTAVLDTREPDLPRTLAWHSTAVFTNLGPEWTTLYRRDGFPVAIERPLGRGSLVLLGDSYPLSNEALVKNRPAALLWRLIGPHRDIVFDESHFGIERQRGVTTLIRQYGLGGVIWSALLVFGLVVWKQGTRFIPLRGEDSNAAQRDRVAGRDAVSGFINLLRRNIPVSRVLSVCVGEWAKAFASRGGDQETWTTRMNAMKNIEREVSAGRRTPVEGYREIGRLLPKGIRHHE